MTLSITITLELSRQNPKNERRKELQNLRRDLKTAHTADRWFKTEQHTPAGISILLKSIMSKKMLKTIII